jgi:NAD+ synthetase
MRLALAQLDTTVGDLEGNCALARAAIGRAAAARADLLVLPELTVTGYPPRDLLDRPAFVAASVRAVDALAAAAVGPTAVLVGFVGPAPAGSVRPCANQVALLHRGAVQAVATKRLLPSYDVFDEDRYFEPGTAPAVVEVAGTRVGITICEDLWTEPGWRERRYRTDPAAECVAAGARVLVNASASPFHAGKPAHRRELLAVHARRHGIPVALCNLVGGNDELLFDGCSAVVGADGRVLAQAAAFSDDLVVADLPTGPGDLRPWPEGDALVWDALVVGVRDYARKCGFDRAVIGVSGGIDSALVACLAAEAFGADRVRCVAMPGPFSAEASLTDARTLAQALGARFDVIPITPLYEAFRRALAPVFGDRPFGVAEENLQARIRGTLLMACSNKFGELLLSTGNKSEMAVGYNTLYGDLAGGLAVIADVPKTQVYRLARLRNGRGAVIPPHTLTRPPTAELAPNQVDADSLPPYDVLDPILAAFVEGGADPEAVAARGMDPATVARVVRMVERNEYKRRQAPPGLRVTARAFGMGRRIPLARRLP